jgi:hypothetical protein
MNRFVVLLILLVGCRKTEPLEFQAPVRVLWRDPCSGPGAVFLNLADGPRVGRQLGLDDSLRNVVRAVNLPDSLVRQGLHLRVRFRLATDNEKPTQTCFYLVAPGPDLIPTVQLLEIQR